jgi:large subunit ribosomal protein L25
MAASTPNTLDAKIREGRGKGPARATRREGLVPAVVYGLGADNESVSVSAHDLDLILKSTTGVNSLITLKIGGNDQLALCRQIVRHPVKGTLTHVDFIRVRADQKVQADVSISLTGDAFGVKAGGRLEQLMFTITIESSPGDIPTEIEHDISELGLGDQLHVRTLSLPKGVVAISETDELVAQIVAPRGGGAEGEDGEAADGEGGESASAGSSGDSD